LQVGQGRQRLRSLVACQGSAHLVEDPFVQLFRLIDENGNLPCGNEGQLHTALSPANNVKDKWHRRTPQGTVRGGSSARETVLKAGGSATWRRYKLPRLNAAIRCGKVTATSVKAKGY
jgi:hypothetical protein